MCILRAMEVQSLVVSHFEFLHLHASLIWGLWSRLRYFAMKQKNHNILNFGGSLRSSEFSCTSW